MDGPRYYGNETWPIIQRFIKTKIASCTIMIINSLTDWCGGLPVNYNHASCDFRIIKKHAHEISASNLDCIDATDERVVKL